MDRGVLEFENDRGGVQFTAKEDGLYVHCHDDLCGDTETGIGAEVGYNLTVEQAKELHAFLGQWLATASMSAIRKENR